MTCFFCKGQTEEALTKFIVDLGNCVVIVKNVPCTTCTQCGESYFSDEVAERLEQIVKACRTAVTEVAIVNYSDQVA